MSELDPFVEAEPQIEAAQLQRPHWTLAGGFCLGCGVVCLSCWLEESAEAGNKVSAKSLTKGSLTKERLPQGSGREESIFFFFVLPENRGEIRVLFIEEQAHIAQSLSMQSHSASLRGKVGKESGKKHLL